MCGFSWFLKQYCRIAPTVLASVYAQAKSTLNHKHKNKSQLQRRNGWSFLLNSERGLWYDGSCDWFENLESARHFRIEYIRNRPIRIRIESRSFAGP